MEGKTILVIEDDRSVCLFLSINLRVRNHQVMVAANVATAWNEVECYTPDLIILDLYLDEAYGLALRERLISARNTTPVVLMTGAVVDYDIIRSYPNVTDILKKPFDLKRLLQAVK